MAHTSASPLRALYRIFVLPTVSTQTTPIRARPLLQSPQPWPSTRQFSQTPFRARKTRPAERRSQRWDSEITALQIYLLDPTTDTLVREVRTRFDVLNSLDTRTHRLVQLSPDEPENPDFIPVCKIVSKKEAYENEKKRRLDSKEQRKANARGSEANMKMLELNWAIDKGDVQHRCAKLREFLGEGRMVEVCFRGKKGGRKATMAECEDLLKTVRAVAEEFDGVKEKGFEGVVGGMASIEFVPKKGKGSGGGDGTGQRGREEGEDDYDHDDEEFEEGK